MTTNSVLGIVFVAATTVACSGRRAPESIAAPLELALVDAVELRAASHAHAVSGTRYVPLTLRAGPPAARVPIRTGVPFPFGAISSLDHLSLELGDGSRKVPAQFDALSRWPDGSLKVVLVQLVGDLGAARRYRIAYGAGVTGAPPPHRIATTTAGGKLTVDTGLVRFSLNGKGVLDALWRDTNDDGRYSPGEQVIDGGDIYLVNAFDGREYTASSAAKAAVTLEENGPLRAVAKVQGVLTNAQGGTHMKYLVRYYASEGSDKIDVEMTVIDDRLESDVENLPRSLAIAVKALGLRWHYVADGAKKYRFGGQAGAVYSGDVSGEHTLLQNGQFHFVDGDDRGHTFSYSGVGTGEKAPGWLALSAGARNVSLMVRDFWQQFPMELSVDGHALTAGLFSIRSLKGAPDTAPPAPSGKTYRRPNTLYFLRPGGAKTYQLRMIAHRNAPTNAELNGLNDSFQRHELDLVASPEWYTASGVWGDMGVGGDGSSSAGYDASLLHDVYEPSIEGNGHDATMFGWRDYGDRLRSGWADVKNGLKIPSFYDDTHVGANNFFKQFLRTGEQRWYHLGEITTRHFMDIDVAHGPRQGYWKTGDAPQPAGELKGMAHENVDHEERNLHWGHAHVSGLSELYLLTGDKRALDVLTEIANWWKFVAPFFYPLPFDAEAKYREAERDYGWPLYVMNEFVRVTNDSVYHREVAGRLVKYLIGWWQTPLKHIGYDPVTHAVSDKVIGTNDAKAGTGYWTMSRMDNHGDAERATGINPWMAGALITNVIKFYEQDMQFAAAGKSAGISHALVQDMLLQAENYLVKYGYDAQRRLFVYSEAIRGDDCDDHHILYGLAYLDRMFKREAAAGRLKHPEWYDTRPLWWEIASRRYDQLRTTELGVNTQSYGFYGYEIIYPPDFFKIMRDGLGR